MREEFFEIADFVTGLLTSGEAYTCSFAGEDSEFVRFSRSAVRQAGTVTARELSLDLIEGRRHASAKIRISGDRSKDRDSLQRLVNELRERRAVIPEDPYLLYATEIRNTDRIIPNRLPDCAAVLDAVIVAGRGRDMVGIYAAGAVYAGFANSLGQRNWHESYSFNFDWSFHHPSGTAVKASYAGLQWIDEEFQRKVAHAAEQLSVVSLPARTIPPGRYRVYLGPAALLEILDTVGWAGFALRAHRTKETPLLKLATGDSRLHPSIRLRENTAEGVAPDFDTAGFVKPQVVTLIEGGQFRNCLISPRSGAEFRLPTNGASSGERPDSLDMACGDIAPEDVLAVLGDGLYVGNLWYVNFSDRSACRMTGMTRFATFWVENGRIREPIQAMRFDESFYKMLGENLVGLTTERELLLDPDTYSHRSLRSARLPGAIVDAFTLTL